MQKRIFQYSDEKFTGFEKESFPMNLFIYMEEIVLFIASQVKESNRFGHRIDSKS